MPGPRIRFEPRTMTYKADVMTGHRDKHYTTSLPTAIMMNKTHADIHQIVSKPVGISHVYVIRHRYGLSDINIYMYMIRHFKQSMGGVDHVYHKVGKCICRIGSKNWWGPCCFISLISIYCMCNIRHVYIVPCHRERIVPKTCQPPGDRSPRLPPSCQCETEFKRGYAALSPITRVVCREHFIEPTDNLRSEQDVHVVAGNAASNVKLMSTIAALSYSTLVPSNFRPESTIVIMSGIIQVTVWKCMLVLVCFS